MALAWNGTSTASAGRKNGSTWSRKKRKGPVPSPLELSAKGWARMCSMWPATLSAMSRHPMRAIPIANANQRELGVRASMTMIASIRYGKPEIQRPIPRLNCLTHGQPAAIPRPASSPTRSRATTTPATSCSEGTTPWAVRARRSRPPASDPSR